MDGPTANLTSVPSHVRARVTARGAVQGVGFRPFVFRLATELGLAGWVLNSGQGVVVEIEGPAAQVNQFLLRLEPERPRHAFLQSLESSWLDPVGYRGFEIRASHSAGEKTALILPDIATCPECRRELFDPANRRYRYPFINCTHCGPRFSIIQGLPYDRPNTTMRGFALCAACRAEYEDPRDRRFHAQPNACPACGPRLAFWNDAPAPLAQDDNALRQAEDAIRQGKIVAVKGLGGFHLVVDARNEAAVRRLRERKHREEKPLALMFATLADAEAHCETSPCEARLLRSSEAPIVLLRRKSPWGTGAHLRPGTPKPLPAEGRGESGRVPLEMGTAFSSGCENANLFEGDLAPSLSPGNPYLGVMLPYTPLHHLLLADLGFPVVATSGNLSDEPICIDETEARQRLAGIADCFLTHNRPIARHVDDSVACVLLDRELVLRRARGYAPLPITLAHDLPPLLAVGAHLKNTVALGRGREVFLSQHIGDLETGQAHQAFRRVAEELPTLYETKPALVVADAHPDYLSTHYAAQAGLPMRQFQHHLAHVAACAAENQLSGSVLGVAWDGTGYGPDGTIWGGEFLKLDGAHWTRAAHLRTFRLPGGEAAVKEPRRCALGVLYEIFGDALWSNPDANVEPLFSARELPLLRRMLEQKINCPVTSSAGRLFDAAAGLILGRQRIHFEGQAAMTLEWSACDSEEHYPFGVSAGSGGAPVVADWAPMFQGILHDLKQKLALGLIAAKFHNTLAELIVAVARATGETRIVLTGGCFQNRRLTERTVGRLRQQGLRPYWHQRVPPNDGGIALGQAVLAGYFLKEQTHVSGSTR